jgi:hypothetical protein
VPNIVGSPRSSWNPSEIRFTASERSSAPTPDASSAFWNRSIPAIRAMSRVSVMLAPPTRKTSLAMGPAGRS